MNSSIYTGKVMHSRLIPVHHRFEYPVYFFAFDLSELKTLNQKIKGFSYNQWNLISLHDADYLQRRPGNIREKLARFLDTKGLDQGICRVTLVTCPRFLGHVFNPVSFYYCYDASDRLRCAVAEVSNTFDERHLYILDTPKARENSSQIQFEAEKVFHVSPFFDRTGTYDFKFSPVGHEIDIWLNLVIENQLVIVSRWQGRAKPLSTRNLFTTLLRYPFSALLTLPRIHLQAVRLYFQKKLKHYAKPAPESPMTIRVAGPKLHEKLSMHLIVLVLRKIKKGKLTLLLPEGRSLAFGGDDDGPEAILQVNHYRFFWRVLRDAGIGLGEGFMARDWESSDLIQVFNVLIINKPYLAQGDKALGMLGGVVNRLKHLGRSNTIFNSRKNIQDHYDLSNKFFQTFLDPSMTYSCAFFESPDDSLEVAQRNKIHRLIQKAMIREGDHVLEIGCGWGAFAIEAVKQTGCRVTGITLSSEQLAYAQKRVQESGLSDKIELYLCDYRKLRGQFDRIVSIEMLEAVGHQYFDSYFKSCDRLLKPDGLAVFQAITIPDDRYESYRRSCDWIQKHIFPGGHLPSLSALSQSMTRVSGFVIEALENIGPHYAVTLRRWREAILANRQRVLDLRCDETFLRKWEYYFLYCEAAFSARHLNNLQLVVTRAGNRVLREREKTLHEAFE